MLTNGNTEHWISCIRWKGCRLLNGEGGHQDMRVSLGRTEHITVVPISFWDGGNKTSTSEVSNKYREQFRKSSLTTVCTKIVDWTQLLSKFARPQRRVVTMWSGMASFSRLSHRYRYSRRSEVRRKVNATLQTRTGDVYQRARKAWEWRWRRRVVEIGNILKGGFRNREGKERASAVSQFHISQAPRRSLPYAGSLSQPVHRTAPGYLTRYHHIHN